MLTVVEVAISVPVLDKDGNYLGAIDASIPMDDRLGLRKVLLYSQNQKVALIGRVDRDLPTLKGKNASRYVRLDYDYHVLLHEIFGEEDTTHLRYEKIVHPEKSWTVTDPVSVTGKPELSPSDETPLEANDDYRDPLAKHNLRRYGDRWIAGFARVGHTGLFDVVQQQYRIKLAGIFYHLGENDMSMRPYRKNVPGWLKSTIVQSRKDLGLPALKWFVSQQPPTNDERVNSIDVTSELEKIAVADRNLIHIKALGLPPQEKKLVIDTAGIVQLGKLIAESYFDFR